VAKRRYTAEEIVTVLRQVEIAIATGKTTAQACREDGITEQTYYRWRKEWNRDRSVWAPDGVALGLSVESPADRGGSTQCGADGELPV